MTRTIFNSRQDESIQTLSFCKPLQYILEQNEIFFFKKKPKQLVKSEGKKLFWPTDSVTAGEGERNLVVLGHYGARQQTILDCFLVFIRGRSKIFPNMELAFPAGRSQFKF